MSRYSIQLSGIQSDLAAQDNAINGILTLDSLDDCALTNATFPGWWGDATDDDPTYVSQWQDTAFDARGNQYRVVFEFDTARGEELGDDEWPWDEQHVVSVHSI